MPQLDNFVLYHLQKQNKLKLSLIKNSPDSIKLHQTAFAKIIFIPTKKGKTAVSLDFQKNDTSKSTIIDQETSKNILENVEPAEIIIE